MKQLWIALPFILFSCHCGRIIEPRPYPVIEPTEVCENAVEAILQKINLDGCTWVLELPSGEKVEPVNYQDFLTETELEKQQPIQIKVVFRDTKSVSICMVGRTVAITCLERL